MKAIKKLLSSSQIAKLPSNYSISINRHNRKLFSQCSDVQTSLYKMCLANSNKYGWSENNLSISSSNIGYSPLMGNGIYSNGIIDVVYDLMDSINNDLSDYYDKLLLSDDTKQSRSYLVSEQNIYEGMKQRLLNISPYIKNWGQAMTLGASPSNITTTISKHIDTINIILQVNQQNQSLITDIPLLFKISLVKTLIITGKPLCLF